MRNVFVFNDRLIFNRFSEVMTESRAKYDTDGRSETKALQEFR
jgi:hypothetical protein